MSPRVALVKIIVSTSAGDGSFRTESMWAEPAGNGRFQIKNLPYYAYGISYDDIVLAKRESEGRYLFTRVVGRSGHSTYRVMMPELAERPFEELWQPLHDLGCTYERATESLFAIDVPPGVDVHAVYAALQAAEDRGHWEFEEAHYAHPPTM